MKKKTDICMTKCDAYRIKKSGEYGSPNAYDLRGDGLYYLGMTKAFCCKNCPYELEIEMLKQEDGV